MGTKRYVCEYCHGTGQVSAWEETPEGFTEKYEPCPLCVEKGWPPFVTANNNKPEIVLEMKPPEQA